MYKENLNINNNYQIMILDEKENNLDELTYFLHKENFSFLEYTNTDSALQMIKTGNIDILLLNFILKPINSIDFLEKIRRFNQDLEIILMIKDEDLAPSIELFRKYNISAYWIRENKFEQLYLILQSEFKYLNQKKLLTLMSKDIELNEKKLEESYLENIKTLRYTVELNDTYSKGHSSRVSEYAALIGKYLDLPIVDIETLRIGGLFHDIGKIGISDTLLNKKDKLTDAEMNEVKTHPVIGKNILSNSSIFDDIIPIVLYHHERYDGTGYPEGLTGDNIPYLARVLAIADSFDAMNSKRSYREALDINYIRNEIITNSGKQFDPEISKTFIDIIDNHYDEIIKIQNRYN